MSDQQQQLETHVACLLKCRRCPAMFPPSVSGGAVVSSIILVGQAPGDKEPKMGRPFAWTAGRTLFKWFEEALGWDEARTRSSIYFSAVCRCFPGKKPSGGDRVPSPEEILKCAAWLEGEIAILKPSLVIPVGKLAIEQFLPPVTLNEVVGQKFSCQRYGHCFDVIPLPHPSGASPWRYTSEGKELLAKALKLIRSAVVSN